MAIAGNIPAYYTSKGAMYAGDSLKLLSGLADDSVQLVMTSPPFALQRKKAYGNLEQSEYVDWFLQFARLVHQKLRDDGSFVIDFGGSYMKGVPARSVYNFRVMLRMIDDLGFFLAEDFYWFNPAKLPSPIEWVNKRKLRAKDSVNTIWWMSKTEWPKADITKVLSPYGGRMKKLIDDPSKFYSPRPRPSGHDIGMGFAKNNGGALPSNLLQIPNTDSNSQYLSGCKVAGVERHPARFPERIPEFFVRMLTEPGDMVVDIFGGSNTTGFVAERQNRRWLTFELLPEYVAASAFRFLEKQLDAPQLKSLYDRIMAGESVDMDSYTRQRSLNLLES